MLPRCDPARFREQAKHIEPICHLDVFSKPNVGDYSAPFLPFRFNPHRSLPTQLLIQRDEESEGKDPVMLYTKLPPNINEMQVSHSVGQCQRVGSSDWYLYSRRRLWKWEAGIVSREVYGQGFLCPLDGHVMRKSKVGPTAIESHSSRSTHLSTKPWIARGPHGGEGEPAA